MTVVAIQFVAPVIQTPVVPFKVYPKEHPKQNPAVPVALHQLQPVAQAPEHVEVWALAKR